MGTQNSLKREITFDFTATENVTSEIEKITVALQAAIDKAHELQDLLQALVPIKGNQSRDDQKPIYGHLVRDAWSPTTYSDEVPV